MTATVLPIVDYDFLCPEGPDAEFYVHTFEMVDGLNHPFEMKLEVVTDTMGVDPGPFLGASIELTITRDDHARTLYGVVSRVEFAGYTQDRLVVGLKVVPAFAMLAQEIDRRIFQDYSVEEILKEVLGASFGPYQRTFDLGTRSRGAEIRDYCVQYGESTFAFVCRLLEEEGISYCFVHDESKQHEVFTLRYKNDEYKEVLNLDGSSIFEIARSEAGLLENESIYGFERSTQLTPTTILRQDYDIKSALSPIVAETGDQDDRNRKRRLYHSMRRRFTQDDVDLRTTDHLEVAMFDADTATGASNATGFSAGRVFELELHPASDLDRKYVLTRVIHSGHCPEVMLSSVEGGEVGLRYANRFECVPLDTPIRPAQVTRKPTILGPQTAIVSGPESEEIHTDDLGRIQVQFHWREHPPKPDKRQFDPRASCWIRVAQTWAGAGWGAVFIPRIGMEVVVQFLEGNPDRPLVTGCVYNAAKDLPYPLPAEKTKSTIKSQSTPDSEGFNEFRFEDAAGSEEVFLHAEKDYVEVVKNDHTTSVGHDQTHTVSNDRTRTVKGNELVTIEGNRNVVINGKPVHGGQGPAEVKGHKLVIDSDYKVITTNLIHQDAKNKIELIVGKSSITIDQTSITLKAGNGASVTLDANVLAQSQKASKLLMTADVHMKSNTGSAVDLKADATVTSNVGSTAKLDGDILLSAKTGATVTLTADAKVVGKIAELKGGTGVVTADPSGVAVAKGKIEIKGDKVSIEGGGAKGEFANGNVTLN